MRRIEAEKETLNNNLVVEDTNEQLQDVGTLKYINLFTAHVDTDIQRVGYIVNG